MPLTVDEVSVFVFPSLSHTPTDFTLLLLNNKRDAFIRSVVSSYNLGSVNILVRKQPTEHAGVG